MDKEESQVRSVNPKVFELVTASFVLANRHRFEVSGVHVYRVTDRTEERYSVEPADYRQVERDTLSRDHPAVYAVPRQWGPETGTLEPAQQQLLSEQENAFFVRWNELMAQSPRERIRELAKTRLEFEDRYREASTGAEKVKILASAIETTFLVNRASMGLNKVGLSDDDQDLVRETTAIVQSVVAMVMESHLAVTLFQTFRSLSSGQTLNHIVRVFSTMVAFLVFYNDLHSRGLLSKLRGVFAEHYREAYTKLLPGLPESLCTLDNLVRLPALPEHKLRTYALGALMHDIGKVMDLGYFENGATYDPVRIKQHPILGSGLFQRTYGNKYEDARYIVGDHHNYLFHKDGYGLTRWERLRGHQPVQTAKCSISDTLEVYASGQSLGFLPVEICGLVDVYDALTDPGRVYKDVHEPVEAVEFMEANFLRAHKFDPVVFDLFVDFLRSMGVPLRPELGFQGKYDRRKGQL